MVLATYPREQVHDPRDATRAPGRERRDEEIALPRHSRELARLKLRRNPRHLGNVPTRQLHSSHILMPSQRLQHIRINIQPRQQIREVINRNGDGRAVRHLGEEVDDGGFGHGPVEHTGDEDQRKVRAVAVAFGRLIEDVARAAREAADCYREVGAVVCVGDFAGLLD